MKDTDELTGLLGRSALLESLDQLLGKAAESQASLSLLFTDVDHFKLFNDTYGHVAGDDFLKAVSEIIVKAFGPDSLIGRYGGDEFLAAVPNRSINSVYEAADIMRQAIDRKGINVTVNGQPVRSTCTLSIGLATCPADGCELNDLVEKAKQALYRAKESGGNSICFFEEKDGLTGLYNHFGILRKLDDVCVHAQKNNQSVSIVLLDIDHFDEFNKSYGHRSGDDLLKRVANILTANFKENSFLGRYGGDEYLIVLADCRADSAFVLVEEVRKLVEDAEITLSTGMQTHRVNFHVSGGIATFPTDAVDRVDLLRKADEALYRAKNLGRNRICLPTSSQMVTKTSHFTQTQLERLARLAKTLDKSEAFLLREALDNLLRRYDESPQFEAVNKF
jgi:diguanylate cyclase